MSPNQSLRAAPATPPPPTDKVVKCAIAECDATFRITDSYNFVLSMRHRGPDTRLGGFQCPDPAEIAAGNIEAQHYCCSPEHALLAAFLCARDHIVPQHFAEVQALAEADAADAERKANPPTPPAPEEATP